MISHFPDLGSTSDWLKICFRSTTQIRTVTHHRYGISAIVSLASLCRETSMVALQNVDCFLPPILCVSNQAAVQNINNILFYCELKFSLW